jgi:hypothetical protein
MNRLLRSVLVAALGLLSPALATAQPGTGTIAGAVKDGTGGALPGVTIRIVNEDTGVAVDVVSEEQGLSRRRLPGADTAWKPH